MGPKNTPSVKKRTLCAQQFLRYKPKRGHGHSQSHIKVCRNSTDGGVKISTSSNSFEDALSKIEITKLNYLYHQAFQMRRIYTQNMSLTPKQEEEEEEEDGA